MKSKRVIALLLLLALPILWLPLHSRKHAKPTAVRISSVNKVASVSVPISMLATNTWPR